MTAPASPQSLAQTGQPCTSAQPGCPPSREGQAVCPVCGATVTVDGKFVARECGHGVILTPAGVLVASGNLVATQLKLSAWAYGHLPRVPGTEWRTAVLENRRAAVAELALPPGERMARRAERHAADVAAARAGSMQATLPTAGTMREARGSAVHVETTVAPKAKIRTEVS